MDFEISRRLLFEDKSDEFIFEEGSLVEFNMARLTNNPPHLLSDSDKSNTKEIAVRNLNFGSLVRKTPFQGSLTSCSTLSASKSNIKENRSEPIILLASEENISNLAGLGSRKAPKKNKFAPKLQHYAPTCKTYPRGILKSGKRIKYNQKPSYDKFGRSELFNCEKTEKKYHYYLDEPQKYVWIKKFRIEGKIIRKSS